jgi:hypothetical protein
MNEAQWLACGSPEQMLDHLVRRSRVSERKARLFASACCRRIWPFLNDQARHAVDVAERFADGLATEDERQRTEAALQEFIEAWVYPSNNTWADDARVYPGVCAAMTAVTFYDDYLYGPLHGAGATPEQAAFAVGPADVASTVERCAPEKIQQSALLRDIVGNPFRPVALDPAWLTSTVTALAQGMYESRDFGAMPILADALQDAGCDNDDILNHCRGPGPHVRGCWVVDLVLGKE